MNEQAAKDEGYTQFNGKLPATDKYFHSAGRSMKIIAIEAAKELRAAGFRATVVKRHRGFAQGGTDTRAYVQHDFVVYYKAKA